MAPTQGGFIHAAETPRSRGVARQGAVARDSDDPLPLEGRKLHVHVDWEGPDDRPRPGRRGPAGPRPQRGTIVIDAGRIAAIEPGARGFGRATTIDAATATSCPDSSTSTCTASRDTTRLTGAMPLRESLRGSRATASPRSARRRSRVAPGRSAASSNRSRDARVAAADSCARAAGASRKQLHQPRLPRRAAASCLRVAGSEAPQRGRLLRPRHSRRHRGIAA